MRAKLLRGNGDFSGSMAGSAGDPGHAAQKSRPVFKNGFLRTAIASMYFLAPSSRILRFFSPSPEGTERQHLRLPLR